MRRSALGSVAVALALMPGACSTDDPSGGAVDISSDSGRSCVDDGDEYEFVPLADVFESVESWHLVSSFRIVDSLTKEHLSEAEWEWVRTAQFESLVLMDEIVVERSTSRVPLDRTLLTESSAADVRSIDPAETEIWMGDTGIVALVALVYPDHDAVEFAGLCTDSITAQLGNYSANFPLSRQQVFEKLRDPSSDESSTLATWLD